MGFIPPGVVPLFSLEIWHIVLEFVLDELWPSKDYCYRLEPHPKGKGGGVATIYSNIFSNSQR